MVSGFLWFFVGGALLAGVEALVIHHFPPKAEPTPSGLSIKLENY